MALSPNLATFGNRTCEFTLNNNTEDAELSQRGVRANVEDFFGASWTRQFAAGASGA